MSLVASANMRLKKKRTTTTASASTSTSTDAVVLSGESSPLGKPKSSSPTSSPPNTSPRNTIFTGDDRDDHLQHQQRWSLEEGGDAAPQLHIHNQSARGASETGLLGGDFANAGGGNDDINHQWMMQQQHNPHPTATIRHPSPLPVHQQLFQQPHQHLDTATQQKNVTNYLSPRIPGRAPNRPRRGHDSFIDSPPAATGSKAVSEGTWKKEAASTSTQMHVQFQGQNSQYHHHHQQQQHHHHHQQQQQQQQRHESAFDPFAPSPLTLPNTNSTNTNTAVNGIDDLNADANSFCFQKQSQRQLQRPMHQSGGETNIPSPYKHEKNSSNMPMLVNQNDFEYHTESDDDVAVDGEVARGNNFHHNNHDDEHSYDNKADDSINNTPLFKSNIMMMDKEDQTIDTERALFGTPVKKKKKDLLLNNHHRDHHHTLLAPEPTKGGGGGGKKNRKGGHGNRKKSKVIIDNVDEFTKQHEHEHQHQHQQLYSEDIDDEGSEMGVGEVQKEQIEHKKSILPPTVDVDGRGNIISTTIGSTNMLEIAAHARKLASDGTVLDSVTNPGVEGAANAAAGTENDGDDDNTRPYISPRRIGKSKSLDSQDSNNGNRNQNRNSNRNSFSRKPRDDDEDNNGSILTRRERERFARTSKSWDDDDGGASRQRRNLIGGNGAVDNEEKFARGGIWGDENASFFGVIDAGSGRSSVTRAKNSWNNNFHFNSNSKKENSNAYGGDSKRQRGNRLNASKSWDDDVMSDQRRIGSDERIARWGTWGDDDTSLFGVGSAAAADGNGDNRGRIGDGKIGEERHVMSNDKNSLTHQDDDNDNALSENFNTLEEWDKAEAQWRETISAVGWKAVPPQSSERKMDYTSPRKTSSKNHPWSSDEQSMVFEGLDSRSIISHDLGGQSTDAEYSNNLLSTDEVDDDDDSIFAFGKKDQDQPKKVQQPPANAAEPTQSEQHRLQSPLSVHNPADIFNKIKSGLKQADKIKNRARGIHGHESDGSYDPSDTRNDTRRADDENALAKVVKSSLELESSTMQTPSIFHDATRKNEDKKSHRIKFATETQNTIHTYWAETDQDLSKIEKFDYVDEKDLGRPVGNDKTIKSTPARSGKIAASKKSMLFYPSENDYIQAGSDNDTYGDSTVEDSITYKSGQSEEKRKEVLDELDLTILDHVDNAVTAVAATLGGLFGVGSIQKQPAHEKNGHSGTSGDNARSVTTEDDTETNDTDTYGESTAFTTLNTGTTRTDGSEYDWLDYMRSFIFPKELDGDTTVVSGDSKDDESTFPEDEDSYMLQQALAAARAIHHVQGIEYDETQDINVLTDIKFLVVTVALPLGLLFQEHEIGVWVSQAIPRGNGAKKGVQHGDQLAAVNGNSSVHATLDEIASKISSTPSDRAVELTFLRYVGPLRPVPGSIIQQGFEVTDKSLSPLRKNLPGLFLSKKRSDDKDEQPTSKSGSLAMKKTTTTSAAVASPPVASPSKSNSAMDVTVPSQSVTKQLNKKRLSFGKLLSFKRKT